MRISSPLLRLTVLFVLLTVLIAAGMEMRQSRGQDQAGEKPAPKESVSAKKEAGKPAAGKKTEVDKGLLAGPPVRAGHLTVFPLYHKEKQEPREILCLAEAVDSKSFVVNETSSSGRVSSVEVINNAGKPVLLLSGEVIFGGKQDRIVATDTLIPAKKDEKYSVKVFCVEHGRWTPRKAPGNTAGQFSCGEKKQVVSQEYDETLKRAMFKTPRIKGEGEITKDIPRGTSFDNLSNKNLSSTSTVDAYGVGGGRAGAYGQRWGKGALAREGGSPGSESALTGDLRWLHFHQNKDGSWSSKNFAENCDEKKGEKKCDGASSEVRDVEVTSLALLSYLGNGHTHRVGLFKKTVNRTITYLLSKQCEDGSFKEADSKEDFITSAVAATALHEAFAVTRDYKFKEPAQKALKYILDKQQKDSGWARKKGEKPDTLSTGWGVIVLKTARTAGLNVPKESFEDALKYFDSVTESDGWTRMSKDDKDKTGLPRGTAIALISRIFCGQSRREAKILKGVEVLMKHLPEYDKPGFKKVDFEYWFWGTYSMFQYGGQKWHNWSTAKKKALIDTQRVGDCADGSWDSVGASAKLGRIGTTAYAALTLEIYYRYCRVNPSGGVTASCKPNTQQDVWKEVDKVNKNLGTQNATQTYRAALKSKKAGDKVSVMLDPLTRAFLPDENIIGYACAINGEILFIDIFCDTRLAGQYKYRLLKSYVLEAINRGDKSTGIRVDAQDLADFITQGNKGEISKSQKAHGIAYNIQVTGGVLRTDVKLKDTVVRRAYYKIER